MRRQIQVLPGVVNHDATGAITAKNNGAYVARFLVSYDDGGTRHSQETDWYEVLQSRSIIIPKTARNIDVTFQHHTSLYAETTKTAHFNLPPAYCVEFINTAFDAEVTETQCDQLPNGSNGSLAYSFEKGNYHFVQLQYRPDYHVDLEEWSYVFGSTPGFSVTKAYDWLKADLDAATAAGKLIVLNMHDPVAGDCAVGPSSNHPSGWNPCREGGGSVIADPEFQTAIANQNVVAIFGGHVHELLGQQTTRINNGKFDIPIFHSSSADCERFLLADFRDRYFNVAAIDSSSGSPSFILIDGAQCRAGGPSPNTSITRPQTFVVNRKPSVTGALISAPAKEGAVQSFTAAGSDPDGDTLTYMWDFGDGTGTVKGLDATHTYEDNGSYVVRVTADDGFGGTDTDQFSIGVDNVAPVIASAGNVTSDEGSTAAFTIDITDPGVRDTFTLTIDWKDGTTSTNALGRGTTRFGANHVYADNGQYLASVTLRDKDGGTATLDKTINVRNVNPTISGTPATINENSFAVVRVTLSDPGVRDTFTLTIDWKDGTTQTFTPAQGTTAYSHRYLDDDPTGTPSDLYAVALRVVDKDAGTGTASANVTVRNLAPVVQIDRLVDDAGLVLGATDSVLVGLAVQSFESYTDIGSRDSRVATRSWGDQAVDVLGPVTNATSGLHVYRAAGSFALRVIVTDDDTGSSAALREIRVVTPTGAV
ncbi:MAG: PKD domain-containing protein, partial [Thermoanaerobaculia bacterium]